MPPEGLPATSAQVTHGVPLPTQQQPTAVSTAALPQTAGPSSPARVYTAVPKSPERQTSPEMDVDVGGTPEPEIMALDGESDAIIHQLERSLPRWEGFADVGWTHDIPEVSLRRVTALLRRVPTIHRNAARKSCVPSRSTQTRGNRPLRFVGYYELTS